MLCACSVISDSVTPWTVARQAPLSMGFCRQEHWLLLLLSRFSRVQLFVTPQTAAHQAPLSLGFSRQKYWGGLPFPSPTLESEVAQSCPTPSNPMDYSLPGSSIHGIFQARVLEWGAIAFSDDKRKDHKPRNVGGPGDLYNLKRKGNRFSHEGTQPCQTLDFILLTSRTGRH